MQERIQRGWIGWLANPTPTPLLVVFKLKIKKGNKTITVAILSQIVLISFCQVSHPPFKNPGSATILSVRNSVCRDTLCIVLIRHSLSLTFEMMGNSEGVLSFWWFILQRSEKLTSAWQGFLRLSDVKGCRGFLRPRFIWAMVFSALLNR